MVKSATLMLQVTRYGEPAMVQCWPAMVPHTEVSALAAPRDPISPSRHAAARQIILARGGGLAPWFLVECAIPLLCFSVLTVRYLSFALRACSAAGKSLGHDPVVPSTRPSFSWIDR